MKKLFFTLLMVSVLTVAGYAAEGADPVALTDAYVATLGDEAIARSNAYDEGNYWLNLWRVTFDLIILWLIMHYGISGRIRNWAEKKSRRPWLQTLFYTPVYVVLSSIMILPWTYYTGFAREHQYGLSNHTLTSWIGDQATGLMVGLIALTVMVSFIYAMIRRSEKHWWVWGTGLIGMFLAFALFFSPILISPLFNEYTPMPEGPLKDRVIMMAQANGVPVDDIFVVNQSKQTTRISANVQGMGATARISLNDNLLNNNSEAEVAAVMGHEIGHYALGHSQEMLVYFTLIFGLGLAFVHKTYHWVSNTIGYSWRLRGISDIAGLPLMASLLGVYLFMASPFVNSVIRSNEAEADIFGLNAAQEPDGFATISLKLSTYRKIKPGEWEELIFHDHPSGYNRVLMAMRWKVAMGSREMDEPEVDEPEIDEPEIDEVNQEPQEMDKLAVDQVVSGTETQIE